MTDIRVDVGQAPDAAFSDAARRCAESVNLHVQAIGDQAYGRWVAVRLSDGGSDGVLYDHKQDAIDHQLHETMCAYVSIPPGGMTVEDAEAYLRLNRMLYDAGCRLADPETSVPAWG